MDTGDSRGAGSLHMYRITSLHRPAGKSTWSAIMTREYTRVYVLNVIIVENHIIIEHKSDGMPSS